MNVGILGLGLIGGSLAKIYSGAGHSVYAWDQDEAILSFSSLAGITAGPLKGDTIGKCSLILLSVFPDGCIAWLEENAFRIAPGTFVIDCCGIKENICRHGFPLADACGFTFIGGHPMAGKPVSGFKHSTDSLFEGAPMVLVPPRFDDPDLLEQAKKLLAPCRFGSYSVTTAARHDETIAYTS